MTLSDPLPLSDVPDGCTARARLVTATDGNERLARDRGGRTKLTFVELTAIGSAPSDVRLTSRDERFVYETQQRRWSTITRHYGGDTDLAWTAAVALCRAGIVTLRCPVIDGTRVGLPASWSLTAHGRQRADLHADRMTVSAGAAREYFAESGFADAWIDEWFDTIRRSGLLRRATDDPSLLQRAACCIAALPALTDGTPVGRNDLAARYGGAGGAHALDDGHRLTALVLRAAALITGTPYPHTAGERRALWAAVGVTCDQVSATVIVCNLQPRGEDFLARWLRERAEEGLPTHLTSRDLLGSDLQLARGTAIYVCENPRVLEATLDNAITAPMVSTQGNPSTVTLSLLDQLASGGADIFYRGDFDWPGIAIANRVIERVAAKTWCFDTTTYSAIADDLDDDVTLEGSPIAASWDPQLAPAMAAKGVAIHEERAMPVLLEYLKTRMSS